MSFLGIVLTVLIVVYLFACLFLIVVILGQEGKGGGLSGLMGSSALGDTLGASAAESTLRRWTRNCAILFVFLSLMLTMIGSRTFRGSILDEMDVAPMPEATTEEVTPTMPATQTPAPGSPAGPAAVAPTPSAVAPTPSAVAPTPSAQPSLKLPEATPGATEPSAPAATPGPAPTRPEAAPEAPTPPKP